MNWYPDLLSCQEANVKSENAPHGNAFKILWSRYTFFETWSDDSDIDSAAGIHRIMKAAHVHMLHKYPGFLEQEVP